MLNLLILDTNRDIPKFIEMVLTEHANKAGIECRIERHASSYCGNQSAIHEANVIVVGQKTFDLSGLESITVGQDNSKLLVEDNQTCVVLHVCRPGSHLQDITFRKDTQNFYFKLEAAFRGILGLLEDRTQLQGIASLATA